MTALQEDILSELKSQEKFRSVEYAELYIKHRNLGIEAEQAKGGNKYQAKTMGNYYTISVLSDFLKNEIILEEVMGIVEAMDKEK
jgi:hypothetical protein